FKMRPKQRQQELVTLSEAGAVATDGNAAERRARARAKHEDELIGGADLAIVFVVEREPLELPPRQAIGETQGNRAPDRVGREDGMFVPKGVKQRVERE